jgi:hypothetical protein
MRRQLAAALCSAILCSAVLGFMASSSLAIAQQKTAKAPATPATLGAGSGKTTSDRQVYSSIKDLMESIIDPSADILWGAVGTVVDEEGVHESLPKTPEEWLDLRRAAVRIIEGSNLLMMPGREAAPAGSKSEVPGVELEPAEITALIKKKRKSFDAFAKALRVLGLEALRATEAKNAVLLMEIGGRMQDVCESCHKTFWYPNEKLP